MAQFDFKTLRQALETRDADLLIGLYADDAYIQIVNKNTPPGRPFEITGKSDLETHLLDFCGRDMSHQMGLEVIGQIVSPTSRDAATPTEPRCLPPTSWDQRRQDHQPDLSRDLGRVAESDLEIPRGATK